MEIVTISTVTASISSDTVTISTETAARRRNVASISASATDWDATPSPGPEKRPRNGHKPCVHSRGALGWPWKWTRFPWKWTRRKLRRSGGVFPGHGLSAAAPPSGDTDAAVRDMATVSWDRDAAAPERTLRRLAVLARARDLTAHAREPARGRAPGLGRTADPARDGTPAVARGVGSATGRGRGLEAGPPLARRRGASISRLSRCLPVESP